MAQRGANEKEKLSTLVDRRYRSTPHAMVENQHLRHAQRVATHSREYLQIEMLPNLLCHLRPVSMEFHPAFEDPKERLYSRRYLYLGMPSF